MPQNKPFTSQRDFINTVFARHNCKFNSEQLKVEVRKLRTDKTQFNADFYQNKNGTFQKFFTSSSNCIGDIIEDIKNEFKIFKIWQLPIKD